MKDEMEIYARLEICSGLVVKKWNKEIWQAHLTCRDRAKDLNTNSCAKKHHFHYLSCK